MYAAIPVEMIALLYNNTLFNASQISFDRDAIRFQPNLRLIVGIKDRGRKKNNVDP